MRTRTRNVVLRMGSQQIGAGGKAIYYPCSGSSSEFDSIYNRDAIALTGFSELIADEVGSAPSHNVFHRKMTYDLPPGTNAWQPYDYGAPWGKFTFNQPARFVTEHEDYCLRTYQQIDDWQLTPPTSDLPPGWSMAIPAHNETIIINDLMEQARQMKVDVLQNIVEGNQIWPSFRSILICLPQLRKHWKVLTKRRLIAHASSTYLAWKFGVSPFVSDIAKIQRYVPDISRQFAQYGGVKILRFSRMIPGVPTFSKSDVVYNSGNGFNTRWSSFSGYSSIDPVIRYVLVVRKNDPVYYTKLFKSLEFAMKRFSSSPASLAWEEVPFSFVVDWLVDVRGILRQIDDLIGFQPFQVVSLTKSYSYQLNTQGQYHVNSPCDGSIIGGGAACSVSYKHYERSVLPMPTSLVWRGNYGKSQVGLTAALIGQRLFESLPRNYKG